MLASAGWAVLIALDALEPWHCVVLLLLHGLAGTFWGPADQLMLYDIVGPKDLPSAVRLMATGLQLGMLGGPAIGAALLFTVGPAWGLAVNVLLYVPFVVYLLVVPYDGHARRGNARTPLRLGDVTGVLREVPRYPSILAVMVLQVCVGLFIGSALLPLLPEFGRILGLDESGVAYGLLLVAMATGAVIGGVGLVAIGRVQVTPRLAIIATAVFAAALIVFAFSRDIVLSLGVLLLAGMANLVSSSTSQAVVQLEAPADRRGRFLGAYAMASSGSRVGSGLLVAALGAWVGVPAAVAVNAAGLLLAALALLIIATAARRRMTARTAVITASERDAISES